MRLSTFLSSSSCIWKNLESSTNFFVFSLTELRKVKAGTDGGGGGGGGGGGTGSAPSSETNRNGGGVLSPSAAARSAHRRLLSGAPARAVPNPVTGFTRSNTAAQRATNCMITSGTLDNATDQLHVASLG